MKILVFDIETSPNLAFVWGRYQQDVIAFDSEWEILSVSFKWLNKKVEFYGRDKYSEKDLVKIIYKYFDEADVLIAHNGKKFDVKKVNTKFIEFGLTPPSPYKVVDTLQAARNNFAFNSNRLSDLGRRLGLGEKVKTGGFDLWMGCMKGDKRSWALMRKYNNQDVVLLERIYHKMLPWIKNHPILTQSLNDCPNCSSKDLQKRGFSITRKHKYQRLQCQTCGTWSQIRC